VTKIEKINQLIEIAMRINLETEMSCFVDISGHVDWVQIKVCKSKEHPGYSDQVTLHKLKYKSDYESENELNEKFDKDFTLAIEDLNNVLSRKFTKKYTAYCNLIDMSCHSVFSNETSAQNWVSKMKRKYGKVNAIVGIKEEFV